MCSFEGTGAISRWRIKLPQDRNQFDVNTVSDVIFHIRYTARQGSEELSAAAASNAKPKAGVKAGVRVFDARTEFGDAWYQFKNPETGQKPALTLAVRDAHFPFPPAGPFGPHYEHSGDRGSPFAGAIEAQSHAGDAKRQ